MKTTCTIITMLLFCIGHSQNYPLIKGLTVTPAQPTENDPVMIVVTVETPYQGYQLGQQQHVSQDLYRINLEACYYSGTQPAVQTHIDTFYIGKLPHGYFSISFRARLSQNPGSCVPADSTFEAAYLQVDPAPLSVKTNDRTGTKVWPNPCSDQLFLENAGEGICTIITARGEVIPSAITEQGNVRGIEALSPGVYILFTESATVKTRTRFLKL